MAEVTVYKLDAAGKELLQYPAELVERGFNYVRLDAIFGREDMDLGFTLFLQGDRFIEYFYNDRWYNVFVIYGRDDGLLKGWYCNICRPAHLGQTEIRCEDLALDVWVDPNGNTQVLDENEFMALDLSPVERAQGWAAMQAIFDMADRGRLPM